MLSNNGSMLNSLIEEYLMEPIEDHDSLPSFKPFTLASGCVFEVPDPRPQVPVYRWIRNLFPEDVKTAEIITKLFHNYSLFELAQVIDYQFTECELWGIGVMLYDDDYRIKKDLIKRCALRR